MKEPTRWFPGSVPFRKTHSTIAGYLEEQQRVALLDVPPGAYSQRGFINPNADDPATGNTFGGVNPNLFLVQHRPGFDVFDTACVLGTPGTCLKRAWIAPNFYVTGCGVGHGATDTTTSRIVGADEQVVYSAVPYGGPLCKLMPWWYEQLFTAIGAALRIPAFALLRNTYLGSGTTVEQEWVQPVDYTYAVGAAQYSDYRFAYQRQYNETAHTMVTDGDSGSPVFCGIHGQTIILSFVSASITMGNIPLALAYRDIEYAMRELGTIHGVSGASALSPGIVDLSSFY